MEIGSLAWFVAVMLGTIALGGGIAYGMFQWRRRPRSRKAQKERDEAVERLYEDRAQD